MRFGDLPAWAKDAIHATVDIHFDWRDRVKILLGWRVTLNVDTPTENVCGRAESVSEVSVWRPSHRKSVGMVEVSYRQDGERRGLEERP